MNIKKTRKDSQGRDDSRPRRTRRVRRPKKRNLPHALLPYLSLRDNESVESKILLKSIGRPSSSLSYEAVRGSAQG